jgi:hypothetical protein
MNLAMKERSTHAYYATSMSNLIDISLQLDPSIKAVLFSSPSTPSLFQHQTIIK